MEEPFLFSGLGIALVTPFAAHGGIDFAALARIIDHQVSHQADYLVVLGTTAETPTLSTDEREAVKRFVVQRVNGRIPLMIGIGGNCTQAVCWQLQHEDLTGFDAVLSVVPYYNKPQQEGIYQHYMAIAQASPLPVVLYNVPGRTGVNMAAETTLRIAQDARNVIAIKEASGNLHQIEQILRERPEGFHVISGDDGLTFPLLAEGAEGVISVLGNAYTGEWAQMTHAAMQGRHAEALQIHRQFAWMNELIFRQGNPAGIKAVMSEMQLCGNVLRLPSVPVDNALLMQIRQEMERLRQG
ncbi:MAG: 4-hydroxy-tetrahydrodipicolinate synthase [Paludibacteraceae bacterium]|nr:4-hydroxy-tetrahydrodipicolinate synthase [Paludibacteraceae bacterium]